MAFIFFQGLHYLVLISEVEDVEIFKICLECWNGLAADLYGETSYEHAPSSCMFSVRQNNVLAPMRQFYAPVLSKVTRKKIHSC